MFAPRPSLPSLLYLIFLLSSPLCSDSILSHSHWPHNSALWICSHISIYALIFLSVIVALSLSLRIYRQPHHLAHIHTHAHRTHTSIHTRTTHAHILFASDNDDINITSPSFFLAFWNLLNYSVYQCSHGMATRMKLIHAYAFELTSVYSNRQYSSTIQ
jgi:hypothetical protein